MRRSSLILLIATALTCSASLGSSSDSLEDHPHRAGDVIENATGTIQKVSDEWYGIVPDFDTATRFAPDDLPKAYEIDELRVVFSGVIGEIPKNVRLWGTPLELTEIHLLEE